MILGVILMVLAICLTLYIVFSAVKCRKVFLSNLDTENNDYQHAFTISLSKTTIVVSVVWWGLILLVKLMTSYFDVFRPVFEIEGTMFIIICISIILIILLYRNHMYKKYLKDNVVKVMLVEYSLSFIMGTLYAYILTYAFTSALILF